MARPIHSRVWGDFGGVAYLGPSGNSIATQRAFVMIACFFGGVILSRRALTLRSLALAVRMIKTPMDGVLPLFSFGVLWCVLWSGK